MKILLSLFYTACFIVAMPLFGEEESEQLYFALLGDEEGTLSPIEEFNVGEHSVDSLYAPNEIFPVALSVFSVDELAKLKKHVNDQPQGKIFVATDNWQAIAGLISSSGTVQQEAIANWHTGGNSIGPSTAARLTVGNDQFVIGSFTSSDKNFEDIINLAQLYVGDDPSAVLSCNPCYQYYGYPKWALAAEIVPSYVTTEQTTNMLTAINKKAVDLAIDSGTELLNKPTVDLATKSDLVNAIDEQLYDKLIGNYDKLIGNAPIWEPSVLPEYQLNSIPAPDFIE